MFKDAKVGDKAWDFALGWGEVTSVIEDVDYPIEVCFPGRLSESYTFDGKRFLQDKNPTLFWDEIKFEIPEKPVPTYFVAYLLKSHQWRISNHKYASTEAFKSYMRSNCPAHLLTGQDDD